MIALNQNYFNIDIDSFTPSFKNANSFLDGSKAYISILKEIYSLNKFLQVSIYNVENFLLLNGADSVEKIDNILIKLEEFSEQTEQLLEENELFNKWYNLPLRYAVNKVETSNMSLQAMLGSKQALLMHRANKNHDN